MKTNVLRNSMLAGVMVLSPAVAVTPATAQVSIHVGIPLLLPPPIVFAAPPVVVLLPGSGVYVAPDLADDFYFVGGWWWRPWEGGWYRSRYHDRGWAPYSRVPSFYGGVHRDWRQSYRDHQWEGQAWDYERVPHDRAERNWKSRNSASSTGRSPHSNGSVRQAGPSSQQGRPPAHSKGGGHGKGRGSSGGGHGGGKGGK